jgi:hypothetical protein
MFCEENYNAFSNKIDKDYFRKSHKKNCHNPIFDHFILIIIIIIIIITTTTEKDKK